MRTSQTLLASLALVAAAGSASAAINGVKVINRLFNDFPDSTLVTVNNYPTTVSWSESNFDPFGDGGNFANRHTAYFSEDGGATSKDFNYTDGFDAQFTLQLDSANVNGREAGFHSDLFGLGFFGLLPNGHIAAFGSILPFWDPGVVYTPGPSTTVTLRMVHTPGSGDGVGAPAIASTIQYYADFGSGPITSGPLTMGGLEGGVPSAFPWFVGFGTQNVGGNDTPTSAIFTNISIVPVAPVPTPGAAAVMGLAGLVGLRRRR
jgi:MYXO-CTERM domain-containing protein